MNALKVKNGVVENIAIFKSVPSGWIECPDGVGIDWVANNDGTFSNPTPKPPPLTIKQQIQTLEAQQTPRRMRDALTGNENPVNFLSDLEGQIATLRGQLP